MKKHLWKKNKQQLLKKYQKKKKKFQIKNIDTINDFVDEVGLFEDKNIFLKKL